MLPKERGRYFGTPASWGVAEHDGKPVFDVCFNLTHLYTTQWEECAAGLAITKRFFLMKNDGSWSEFTIESLRESFGWSGRTLKELAESDWSKTAVQLTIDYEVSKKDNKEYIGVLFIHPQNSDPTSGGREIKNDPQAVQNLDAKYGAQLRAKFGAAKPGTSPKNGSPAKAPAAQPTGPKTIDSVKRSAWTDFQMQTPDWSKEKRAEEWKITVSRYGPPGKSIADLTLNDWEIIANQIAEYGPWKAPPNKPPILPDNASPEDLVPAGGPSDETIKDDDIPF